MFKYILKLTIYQYNVYNAYFHCANLKKQKPTKGNRHATRLRSNNLILNILEVANLQYLNQSMQQKL